MVGIKKGKEIGTKEEMNKKLLSFISLIVISLGISYVLINSLKGIDLDIFDFEEDTDFEEE